MSTEVKQEGEFKLKSKKKKTPKKLSKKEEITKEDLFRVRRGDIRVKMFSKYKKISDEDLPNFFKRIKKIEEEMEYPIFGDVNWE